jgi:RNA polymerase sigma-70 factor (ECF subfamily)
MPSSLPRATVTFDALIAVLDPEVLLHADASAAPAGSSREARGAPLVADGARLRRTRPVRPARARERSSRTRCSPPGRLFVVLRFTYTRERISAIDVIADPERLRDLDLAALSY